MDLVQQAANGNAIQAYGPKGFRVSGEDHASSILITESFLALTPIVTPQEITMEGLAPLLATLPRIEMLVIGTGARMQQISPLVRQTLRAQGINADVMDTGAACRTYTILHSEGRRAGAVLLIPV